MLKKLILILLSCLSVPLFAEIRSFDAIFSGLPAGIRTVVFSEDGYFASSVNTSGLKIISTDPAAVKYGLDSRISDIVLDKKPGFLIESLLVIPEAPNKVTLLDIYNTLGNIRDLKGRLYFSETRGKNIPLFEDATRLESEKKHTPIPDPPPDSVVPRTETVFIRLKDVNFGNSYYRGDIAVDNYGIRYCLSNNRNLNYLFIPVIKEGKFTAQLYIEPIQEGVLIYSIAGADVSDFISSKIDIPSAISKRLAVIISWVTEGIGKAGKRP
jgi:hypothetical protein